jgi:hypothetical protein
MAAKFVIISIVLLGASVLAYPAEELDNKLTIENDKNETSNGKSILAEKGTDLVRDNRTETDIDRANRTEIYEGFNNLTQTERCEIYDRIRNNSELRQIFENSTSQEYRQLVENDFEKFCNGNESIVMVEEKNNGTEISSAAQNRKVQRFCSQAVCDEMWRCAQTVTPSTERGCYYHPWLCCPTPGNCNCVIPL